MGLLLDCKTSNFIVAVPRVSRDKRLEVSSGGRVLALAGVQRGDAGHFSCETEAAGGGVTVEAAAVTVLAPPSVTIRGAGADTGRVISVKAGAGLVLGCRAEGVPAPAVSWWVHES